jgi:uncharacterized coiled-coil DUF342 family protein
MAKTVEELTVEVENINTQIKELKESRAGWAKLWDEAAVKIKELSAQRAVLNTEMQTLRVSEKASKKEAHLQELIKAKEEAARLGIKVTSGRKKAETEMPVAAHRSEVEDPLAGNLTEEVNIDDLEKELNIF